MAAAAAALKNTLDAGVRSDDGLGTGCTRLMDNGRRRQTTSRGAMKLFESQFSEAASPDTV
jgi:hypothetical protein